MALTTNLTRAWAIVWLVTGCSVVEAQIPPTVVEQSPTERDAIAAWHAGQTERALEIYESLIQEGPPDPAFELSARVLRRELGWTEREGDVPAEIHAARDRLFQAAAEFLAAESGGAETGIVEALLDEALTHEPHFPLVHLLRGVIAFERGDWADAVESFVLARRQDSALTIAFVPHARALYELGRVAEAHALLTRAAIAMPWDESIPPLRARWEANHPELTARAAEAAIRRRVVATPPRVAVDPERREAAPAVRVGLADDLRSVYVKTGGEYAVMRGENLLFAGVANEVLRVQTESDLLLMERETADGIAPAEALAVSSLPLRIVYPDPTATTIVFDLVYGQGQFSAGRGDRAYRGALEFYPVASGSRFNLINELPVEEYLYSVVPSEMPAHWPVAALEAQAIAARSYTLHPRTRFHPRGYDLQSSVLSAYYRGVEGETARTTAAVRATHGLVLMDGERVLDAVYSANTAGYTESSASVWGSATALVGVSDPLLPPLEEPRSPAALLDWIASRPESYSGAAPYADRSAYRWIAAVPHQEIAQRLRNSGRDVGRVLRVLPLERGVSGRVERVRVVGTIGEAVVARDSIRSLLGGLRSNLFVARPVGDAYFVFEGAGWGHGVGMCQTGAAGMAAAGISAAAIVAHYYPAATLVQRY